MTPFARYITASTISKAGNGLTEVAFPLVAVLTLGATSLETSLVAASPYFAWLVIGLPAGTLVSRLPMRATQVVMDLVRALVLISIPIAAWFDILTIAQLVVAGFLISLCSVIYDVANSTFIVSIVPEQELMRRNSQTSGAFSTAQIAGPPLGGLLVQLVGAAAALIFDVVSYLVSAVLLAGLARGEQQRKPKGAPMRSQIAHGIRFVFELPVLRACTVNVTCINFVCGAQMGLTPVFLVRSLGGQPWQVGLIYALEGLGSVLGAMVTLKVAGRVGSTRALLLAASTFSVACLLLPAAPVGTLGLLVFAVGNTVIALTVTVTSVLTRTHRQTVTPYETLPQVMATVRFISWGVIPLGALLAGLVATLTSPRVALLAACVVAVAAPLLLAVSAVRHLTELADDPAMPAARGRV